MAFLPRRRIGVKTCIGLLILLLCFSTYFLHNEEKSTLYQWREASLHTAIDVVNPSDTEPKRVETPKVPEIIKSEESAPKELPISFQDYRNVKNCPCFGDTEVVSLEVEACVKASCVPETPTVSKPSELIGPKEPEWSDLTMSHLVRKGDLRFVKTGGWWSPENCKSDHHVAVIIPVRERDEQLPVLLRHLLPILQRRNKHFSVFVIEQNKKDGFNKGKLLNVGFKEAQKYFPYTCFVFHDVDLLVESDDVYYGCEMSPMHVASRIDRLNYKLLYDYMTSGVQMFTKADYELVNGFSNSYWHYGGEDDNLFDRIEHKKLTLHRQKDVKFTELKRVHKKKEETDPFVIGADRVRFNAEAKKYLDDDGLNNLHYSVEYSDERTLYTYLRVDLLKNENKEFGNFEYGKNDLWTKLSKERSKKVTEKPST